MEAYGMSTYLPATSRPAEHDITARALMTPGVVAISVTTRLPEAARALGAHRIHAVLVVSCYGKPAGWLTAHKLLPLVDTDRTLQWAVDAIGEPITRVDPHASRDEVVRKLSEPGVARLAVQENPDWMPEGVISDIDLARTIAEPA
jgi:CBS domain-containing protein